MINYLQLHLLSHAKDGCGCCQVEILRHYLGELAIMLFEERKLQLIMDMCQEDNFLVEDAEFRLMSLQEATMLDLLDSYWSLFLQVRDASRLNLGAGRARMAEFLAARLR